MKKSNYFLSSAAVVALICITSACSSPQGGVSEGQVVDDRKLEKAVEKRLANDPVYKNPGVDVRTYNGVVQLSGFVDSEDQKQRAEQVARDIPGVANVENALIVKPVAAENARIRDDLREVDERPYPNPDATQTYTNSVNRELNNPNNTR
jgi:hyperosmotically inducible periplasmic protein